MFERHHRKIEERKIKKEYRFLSFPKTQIDFFSNDYLGLSNISFKSTLFKGSTGSRLLSGNSKFAEDCESNIATYFESESALCLGSGYLANLAVMSTLPLRGDTILYDEFIHASLRDGIRLSFAHAISYRHNDLNDLELKLKSAEGQIYIVTEGLFSMDGDIASLGSIAKLSKKYNACLVVDEAHSMGVFGKGGRGLAHGMDLHDIVDIRIATFGKAFGYHGAAILCSDFIKKVLINFARPFIYSTAPSLDFFERINYLLSEQRIREEQERLHANIDWFRTKIKVKNNSEENSPIQVVLGEKTNLLEINERLMQVGIFQKPIFSPTVAEGNERIRICLHSFNKISELKLLKSALDL